MLFALKPKVIFKPEQREENSYNLPMGQSKFSHELRFWFTIENGGKKGQKYLESINVVSNMHSGLVQF